MKSEVETQYQQILAQGTADADPELKCRIIDQLLINKFLLNQAYLDSVEVTDHRLITSLTEGLDTW
ncbi:MAG: hypothetical protein IPG39_19860 [Bacteroidetes bacterium]|nr:hypothetical protein [Bacteroidota bacterium]